VEYTNGEKTGLNKYETKVSQNITTKHLEVQNGVQKGPKWNRLRHLVEMRDSSSLNWDFSRDPCIRVGFSIIVDAFQ